MLSFQTELAQYFGQTYAPEKQSLQEAYKRDMDAVRGPDGAGTSGRTDCAPLNAVANRYLEKFGALNEDYINKVLPKIRLQLQRSALTGRRSPRWGRATRARLPLRGRHAQDPARLPYESIGNAPSIRSAATSSARP